jgi:hypothetical protein
MTGEWDPRWEVAIGALDRAGAAPGDPVVVRDGLSLLVRRADVVVRVRRRSLEPVAAREVAVATTLAEAGVPVTPLAYGDDQPWIVGNCAVTAWQWLEGTGPVGPTELGALAYALRERTVGGPVHDVARFDPIAAIRAAVEHLPVGDDQGDQVRRMAHELTAAWARVADVDPLGTAVVHGDLHRDNVVAGPMGPVLTDLELAGAGPPSYDVAPAVVAVARYGADPAGLDAFIAAYGSDPREWWGFATCVNAYELWVTAWAVGVRDRAPQFAVEAERRLASLREGADHRWELH